MSIPEWYRGTTYTFRLGVTADGVAVDLTAATGIELRLKADPTDPDPPLLLLSLGGGIALRDQTGVDLGVADVTIDSDDIDSLSDGFYWYDVYVYFAGTPTVKRLVVKPTYVQVKSAP